MRGFSVRFCPVTWCFSFLYGSIPCSALCVSNRALSADALRHMAHVFLVRVGAGISLPFSSSVMVFVPKLEQMVSVVPDFIQSGVTEAMRERVMAISAKSAVSL